MSNSNGIIKCPHCGAYFFQNLCTICIYCGKSLYLPPDIFNDIFGKDNNPFKDFKF